MKANTVSSIAKDLFTMMIQSVHIPEWARVIAIMCMGIMITKIPKPTISWQDDKRNKKDHIRTEGTSTDETSTNDTSPNETSTNETSTSQTSPEGSTTTNTEKTEKNNTADESDSESSDSSSSDESNESSESSESSEVSSQDHKKKPAYKSPFKKRKNEPQRMSAPELPIFDGHEEKWHTWKSRAEASFDAAGLIDVLNHKKYSRKNKGQNALVFSQIQYAVGEGHASYLVKQHRNTRDGHKAWQSMVDYFDGKQASTDTARLLYSQVSQARLVPGTTASLYINAFMDPFLELQEIKRHSIRKDRAKMMFIEQIKDPDYKDLVNMLKRDYHQLTLKDLIRKLRNEEIIQRQSREETRRPKRTVQDMSDPKDSSAQDQPAPKSRKSESEKIGTLPAVLRPQQNGMIVIRPRGRWFGLKESHKEFVQQYNAAVKHNKDNPDLPPIPDGVTIGEPEDSSSNKPRRVRRSTQPPDPTPVPVPSDPEDIMDIDDEDIEMIPDTREKAVTFHLRPASSSTKRRFTCTDIKQSEAPASPATTIHRSPSNPASPPDVFVVDTGGGAYPTITERAWLTIGGQPGLTATMNPYQTSTPITHPVVHAVTKVHLKDSNIPVLFKVNFATMIPLAHDPNERESLMTTMDLGYNGVKINGIHPTDEKCGMTVSNRFFPFEWNDSTIYFRIEKPTKEDLDTYQIYELNSPRYHRKTRRNDTDHKPNLAPIGELRKRLGMIPEDRIQRTLEATTQFYTEIEDETRDNPRKHFRKRFKALCPRQDEEVSSDFVYIPTKTSQGHIGAQFFSGITSKRWAIYPLKQESHNIGALQDYIREYGAPQAMITDNAKSETGSRWTEIMREYCIKTKTSEPHHPHQNPCEQEWGKLAKMVQNSMRAFQAPKGLSNWCMIWCCQVNNYTARKALNWRTPMEVSTGHTPDISKFRFHFYEPIWYFEPSRKLANDNLLRARFLALAESCGDAMTYYILTEPNEVHRTRKILMRSVIRTRRKNIGRQDEYISEDPNPESFTLTLSEHEKNIKEHQSCEDISILRPGEQIVIGTENNDEEMVTETRKRNLPEDLSPDLEHEENLPAATNATSDDAESYLQLPTDNHILDSNLRLRSIINHSWDNNLLMFQAKYEDSINGKVILSIPFQTLKKDEPVKCARYIKEYIPEPRRGDRPLNTWATDVLTEHIKTIKRMVFVDPTWHSLEDDPNTRLCRRAIVTEMKQSRKRPRLSGNQRRAQQPTREKFGFKIPNNAREAFKYDAEAGNNRWKEAINKEMKNLERLKVFKFHPPTHKFPENEGWQKAPLRMIYDVKNEPGHRFKARLVIGGHKVDSTDSNTYSSQVDRLTVSLLFLVARHQNLDIMTADVTNAFPTAPNQEKVWCVAGEEFGDKAGMIVEIQRALYGLAGSARAFADFLADCLWRHGFSPSRADPDLWIRKSDDGTTYEYIATHVDDLIVVSKDPQHWIALIEQEFALRNVESEPKYYLGTSLTIMKDGRIKMECTEYIKESIRKYQQQYHITLKKQAIPMPTKAHPETDESELLDITKHKEFQHIIGLAQWIILIGRIDITYATSSLSRFSSKPRQGHLELARHLLGYLKKFPKKGIVADPRNPNTKIESTKRRFEDYGHQYKYFKEQLDHRFPELIIKELSIIIFCDSDHAHDLVSGRSITGLIAFVGSTPVYWKSKRQTSVQTSTFGAEFTALKTATELAIELRYNLRSMGMKIEKPTRIYVDNKSVVVNSVNPASTLNKKAVALAYHFVRQHQSGGVTDIHHIDSEDNYADCLTKPLNSNQLRNLLYEFMIN